MDSSTDSTARLDIAIAIVTYVREEVDGIVDMGCVAPSLDFDVHMPELRVTVVYSEPKALPRLQRGRRRRRECRGCRGSRARPKALPCRCDIMECFSFVRSSPPPEQLTDDVAEDEFELVIGFLAHGEQLPSAQRKQTMSSSS
ncbi:hypothetical protein ZWY2020_011362 [Hordeum vulgare]|nr:hypothetical protein ZWY2020_011362 [Hordeum vulgare]